MATTHPPPKIGTKASLIQSITPAALDIIKLDNIVRLFAVLIFILPTTAATAQQYESLPVVDFVDNLPTTPVDYSLDYESSELAAAGELTADCDCDGSCRECLACRQRLFGNLFGPQSCLAQRGIIADLELTQFYQGVTSGGVRENSEYGGKFDTMLTFLGEPLGLHPGLTIMFHAETRYGDDVNANAGALAFPNTNMLYPLPGKDETAITGLLFMQALNEKYVMAAGKINILDLWQMLYPNSGRGVDGFMNLSMIATPTFLRTTNLSVNGAGILVMEGPQVQSGLLIYDTNNSSTTSGLDDLFDQGAVVLGYHRFFTEYRGLPGSHGFMGNYSNRTYTSTDPTSWTILPGQGLAAGQKTGSWTIAYILDQMLWIDCCNENRNLRLFSQWALSDADPSPYRWSYNVALQGQGLVCGRDADTMGVGYFFDQLSSDFKRLVSTAPQFDLQNVHGMEMYYNAAITPWFHLTADLQVIDNQNVGDDTAVILGLRGKIDF